MQFDATAVPSEVPSPFYRLMTEAQKDFKICQVCRVSCWETSSTNSIVQLKSLWNLLFRTVNLWLWFLVGMLHRVSCELEIFCSHWQVPWCSSVLGEDILSGLNSLESTRHFAISDITQESKNVGRVNSQNDSERRSQNAQCLNNTSVTLCNKPLN